jgi:hypothetical protein
MSLYNMLFGVNPNADQLLGLLGKTRADFGRFRDVFVEHNMLVVHTRCGGGNRDDYANVFAEMRDHPWYSHDADDDFDFTYCNFYFNVPVNVLDVTDLQDLTPNEKWSKLLGLLQDQPK